MTLTVARLCCWGCNTLRQAAKLRPAYLGAVQSVRTKTDSENSTDIVVEKEEPERRWKARVLPWEKLTEKLSDVREGAKEVFKHPTKQRMRGRAIREDEVLYYFRQPEDLEYWYAKADEEIGGKSWAELVQSENGMTAMFRGYISQRLPQYLLPSHHDKLENTKMTYNPYAYLNTQQFSAFSGREDFMSVFGHNVFEIRLRGDGRAYAFEAMCVDIFEQPHFTIPIYTRGGPEWQTVRIPYSKFIATKHSGLRVCQFRLDVHKIRALRFLLMDEIQGPFQLELDYIALRTDHTESGGDTDYYDPYMGTNKMIGTL